MAAVWTFGWGLRWESSLPWYLHHAGAGVSPVTLSEGPGVWRPMLTPCFLCRGHPAVCRCMLEPWTRLVCGSSVYNPGGGPRGLGISSM